MAGRKTPLIDLTVNPVSVPAAPSEMFAPIAVPTAEQRAEALNMGDFGGIVGKAARKTVDDLIKEDPIIVNANAVASTVNVSEEVGERIVFYAIRTIELSAGHFDFHVNFRFENPRRDLANAAEGVLSIQGYRDRLCQLEIELRQAKKRLDSAYDTGLAYLFEQYTNKMESFSRDAFMRGLFIGKVFKPLEDKRKDVKAYLEQIESALSNLDKAHYAYKAVVDVGRTILDRVEGRAG